MKNTNALQNSSAIDLNWSDAELDEFLYPKLIQDLSSVHWTPVEVARRASEWLAPKAGTRVLDIGSGVGKFCIVGACHTEGHFTGVEHRESLVKQANRAMGKVQVKNITFLHADIISVDFSQFDSFYFYNPFFEHLAASLAIDREVELSNKQYKANEQHVLKELNNLKAGTRLVTYCSTDSVIPGSFELDRELSEEHGLRFWVKG